MFLPIHDQNTLKTIPVQYVTIVLIGINIALFFVKASGMEFKAIASFAVVPLELREVGYVGGPANGPNDLFAIPERYTMVSYMFFHHDLLHLVGNMLFLWVFGDNVEDALGHFKFLIFYILCGVAAALAHTWSAPDSGVPLIGASGSVAGVIAAYLMLHPRVQVWVLVMRVIPWRIPAIFALGAWIVMQFVMVLMPTVEQVAWWAHIGGLAAGAVLVVFLRRPGVPLFDRGLSRPA